MAKISAAKFTDRDILVTGKDPSTGEYLSAAQRKSLFKKTKISSNQIFRKPGAIVKVESITPVKKDERKKEVSLKQGIKKSGALVKADSIAPTKKESAIVPTDKKSIAKPGIDLTILSVRVTTLEKQVSFLAKALDKEAELEKKQQKEKEKKLLQQEESGRRSAKEKQLEKSLSDKLLSPVKAIGGVAKGLLGGLMELFGTLFAGWLTDKGWKAIKAFAEGDTAKLEGIKNEVVKALAVVGGIFLALNGGIGVILGLIPGIIAAATSFGALLTNPATWIAGSAVLARKAYYDDALGVRSGLEGAMVNQIREGYLRDYGEGNAGKGQFITKMRDQYGRIAGPEEFKKMTDEEKNMAQFLKLYDDELKNRQGLNDKLFRLNSMKDDLRVRPKIEETTKALAASDAKLKMMESQIKFGDKSFSQALEDFKQGGEAVLPQTSLSRRLYANQSQLPNQGTSGYMFGKDWKASGQATGSGSTRTASTMFTQEQWDTTQTRIDELKTDPKWTGFVGFNAIGKKYSIPGVGTIQQGSNVLGQAETKYFNPSGKQIKMEDWYQSLNGWAPRGTGELDLSPVKPAAPAVTPAAPAITPAVTPAAPATPTSAEVTKPVMTKQAPGPVSATGNTQVIYKRVASGGGAQMQQPLKTGSATDVPLIASSNPNNFYTMYSQMVYNVVI